MSAGVIDDISTLGSDSPFADDMQLERSRFLSILRRHMRATGTERSKLRNVVIDYLRFSPNADELINSLISTCVESKITGRLDVAIDILSQLGVQILRYAWQFLVNDIKNWNGLYPNRAYEPNDDYWYILLRSVAQSDASAEERVRFVRMCGKAQSRQVLEAVVESLGDIGTPDAFAEIEKFAISADPFIAELASELLSNQ